jgi:hypothetical protein
LSDRGEHQQPRCRRAARDPGRPARRAAAKANAGTGLRSFSLRRRPDRGEDARAHRLLADRAMHVLEARFHPRRRAQADFVMLGYLVWRGRRDERPVFEPARATVPDAVLSKLQYLVGVTEPDSFERLQALRSDYWSFVPIAADETGRPPEQRNQFGS